MLDELHSLTPQLNREKSRLATATAANKPKFQASVDEMTAKAADLEKNIAAADKEISRAFAEYNKAFNMKRTDPNAPLTPQERSLLNEMATNYYTYRNYDDAARTWAKLIAPAKENTLAA